VLLLGVLTLAGPGGVVSLRGEPAAVPQAAFLLDLLRPAEYEEVVDGDLKTWRIRVAAGAVITQPLTVGVVLASRVESCLSDPSRCDGAERTVVDGPDGTVYGCADHRDNDGDGLVDFDDPDCKSVQGWSFSLQTGYCLQALRATTRGTAADLSIRSPGLRDPEGSFEKTEVVMEDYRAGAVSAVVLSFVNPVILPPVGEILVMRLEGELGSIKVAPGEATFPCLLEVLPQNSTGLRGSGERVVTVVTIAGNSAVVQVSRAEVSLVGVSDSFPFRRGDPNDDGRVNLADAVWIVNELFRSGPATPCAAAADANADLSIDLSDVLYLLAYQLAGEDPPPAPFPACASSPQGGERCVSTPQSCAR
jgi:hypothetical protein